MWVTEPLKRHRQIVRKCGFHVGESKELLQIWSNTAQHEVSRSPNHGGNFQLRSYAAYTNMDLYKHGCDQTKSSKADAESDSYYIPRYPNSCLRRLDTPPKKTPEKRKNFSSEVGLDVLLSLVKSLFTKRGVEIRFSLFKGYLVFWYLVEALGRLAQVLFSNLVTPFLLMFNQPITYLYTRNFSGANC